ncbi:MAG: hypothetical protein Q7N87_01055 [Candidatus Uhrbacteria bacterium]|nr:hypothetical protein [Candidatus Uhrbacteria bacterium]
MTTIVNTPPTANDQSGSGVSAIIITILILGSLFAVFYIYFLPMLRNSQKQSGQPTTIKVELPAPQPSPSPSP